MNIYINFHSEKISFQYAYQVGYHFDSTGDGVCNQGVPNQKYLSFYQTKLSSPVQYWLKNSKWIKSKLTIIGSNFGANNLISERTSAKMSFPKYE